MSDNIASKIGLLEYPAGRSADAILAHKLGLSAPSDYPYDPSDLGRCIRAHGKEAPEVMRGAHRVWDTYLDHWDQLIGLYEAEAPSGKCPELYALMRQLRKEVTDV